MKSNHFFTTMKSFFLIAAVLFSILTNGQSTTKNKRMISDSKKAIKAFKNTDASMNAFFDNSYGYVVFPNVGKGGLGIGGAFGNGIVFQKNTAVGTAKLSQVSIGLQAGGQGYREVIFFENKSNFDEFKENNLKLSAQVSAVIAASGASANANYANGILIFAQPKGGLMYEVSVGGQTFNYEEF
jgi:lipid-binding SYLF domain-containing protein